MSAGSISVRARLTLWHAGVLGLIVVVFSAAILMIVRHALYRDLDQQLERALATVEKVYREDPRELEELDAQVGIAYFQLIAQDGRRYRTDGWERAGIAAALADGSTAAPRTWHSPRGRSYRLRGNADPALQIVVALDERSVRHSLETLAVILAIGIPCAIGFAVVGGYFLAGRILVPVGTMADRARRITAESLGERLAVGNPDDEFGRLAGVFNDAFARVQASFEQLRRFTADASHELRTPLTAMRSVGEVALQKPLDAAAYRDVIGSMLEEVERLTRIVESLLTLTRAESGALQLKLAPVELGALAAGVAEQLRVLTEEKEQSLRVEAAAPVTVHGDATILGQALMNLLHNAIKFTPAGGSIVVRTETLPSAEKAVAIVDSGPGIAPADRLRIFDRFYRAGGAGEAGGAGLGLAIARWAIEAHGGRIEVESAGERGSLFRIVLPAG